MRVKKNIALSETGFIFDPGSGDSFSMNQTAKDIVELLKKGSSTDEIKEYLKNKYEVEDHIIEKEIFDFINMLKHYQLIEEDEQTEN
jgi:hypothetical protein